MELFSNLCYFKLFYNTRKFWIKFKSVTSKRWKKMNSWLFSAFIFVILRISYFVFFLLKTKHLIKPSTYIKQHQIKIAVVGPARFSLRIKYKSKICLKYTYTFQLIHSSWPQSFSVITHFPTKKRDFQEHIHIIRFNN